MLNGPYNHFGISILHQSMKDYTKFPCHNFIGKQWYAVRNKHILVPLFRPIYVSRYSQLACYISYIHLQSIIGDD